MLASLCMVTLLWSGHSGIRVQAVLPLAFRLLTIPEGPKT